MRNTRLTARDIFLTLLAVLMLICAGYFFYYALRQWQGSVTANRAVKTDSAPDAASVPTLFPVVWDATLTAVNHPAILDTPTPVDAEPQPASQNTPVPIPERELNVHFIDVGQGDTILIEAPDGATGLIDGGEAGSGVVNYLAMQGVNNLDVVIATHPHSDHIGGLPGAFAAFQVDMMVTNGMSHTGETYELLLDAINAEGCEYIEVQRGDIIPLGSISLDVVSAAIPGGDDPNQDSIVLRLVYGETEFLFTGDAGDDAEWSMLLGGTPVDVDILKVGHHGSRTSSTPIFLDAVSPELAIYSAGLGNAYGHPHPETITALQGVGADVLGTDLCGTVVVSATGEGYTVSTARPCLDAFGP